MVLTSVLAVASGVAGGTQVSDSAHHFPKTDFAGLAASQDTRIAASWIAANAGNQRLPFVIVDKKNAQLFVFDANRRLKGSTSVLLGLAVGDKGLASMAGRDIASLQPFERTTPAGRFMAEPGRNLKGEEIIWLDYDAQLAIHRLRPEPRQANRARRLASPSVADNRISMGCVIVPVAFYEKIVAPVLGNTRSVVYVLPEVRPLQNMLGALQSGLYQ